MDTDVSCGSRCVVRKQMCRADADVSCGCRCVVRKQMCALTHLIDHRDGDDGGVEVGAPQEVRRRRLGESQSDSGLRQEGHPVTAAEVGWLARHDATQVGGDNDAHLPSRSWEIVEDRGGSWTMVGDGGRSGVPFSSSRISRGGVQSPSAQQATASGRTLHRRTGWRQERRGATRRKAREHGGMGWYWWVPRVQAGCRVRAAGGQRTARVEKMSSDAGKLRTSTLRSIVAPVNTKKRR